MDASTLLKFLPMLVMLGSLSYAVYTIQWIGSTLQPALNVVAMKKSETKPDGPGAPKSHGKEAASAIAESLRDLFQVVGRSASEQGVENAARVTTIAPDPTLALVAGLSLNATLIQGRTQLAVIDGRVYKAGQHLEARDGQQSPLSLTKVFAQKVVLEAEGKHYVLAYPESLDNALAAREDHSGPENPTGFLGPDPQMALIQSLLSSPLGGLGASLLGQQGRGMLSNLDSGLHQVRGRKRPASTSPRRPPSWRGGASSTSGSDQ
ncbi:MAG: hypothetical protein ACP5XB_16925 [Isosphaeraceae bacterium]